MAGKGANADYWTVVSPGPYRRVGLLYWAREVCIACQMRWLGAGMSWWVTQSGASAFMRALTMPGSAPTVPASTAPFAPNGLSFVGQGLLSTLIGPIASARGIA